MVEMNSLRLHCDLVAPILRVLALWVWLGMTACGSLSSPAALESHQATPRAGQQPPVQGWLQWRGPDQNGTSVESGLPDHIELNGVNHAWSYDLSGRGTPVIANGRVYVMGYEGAGPDLEEMIVCLDAETGERIWEHRFSDFLSDVVYNRYAISAPVIDPHTGNVYCLTTPGLLKCFTANGRLVWQRSLMEEIGRLTYPNGRTLGPLIDGDRVILHCMTSSWGGEGPTRDRFYAFDKGTGALIWASTPGGPPKDSPYSFPVFERRDGRRLLYAGTAGGNMVAVDANTGDPVWRFRMSIGGVCASPVLYKDTLIAVHGRENLDTSEVGRMIAIKLGAMPEPGASGPLEIAPSTGHEKWRNDLISFTSSPVLDGDRVYLTNSTGELCCINADTGEVLWRWKLAPDQIHASPVFAGGKLYVPMNNGLFYIIRPTDEGPEILSKVQLEGNCLGAPATWMGRIYVHTTEKLYCFGSPTGVTSPSSLPETTPSDVGAPSRLQIIPADVLVHPGETVQFRARLLDGHGLVVDDQVNDLSWGGTTLDLTFAADGTMGVADDARSGVAVMTAETHGLAGSVRIRIVPSAPFAEDFEGFTLRATEKPDGGATSAFPPGHWIQMRIKWEVVERDGNKLLAKTIRNPLFQRAMGFIGHPDESGYTMQMDIMSDGNRRILSTAGMVNQRYLILLKGNHQEIEISSNMERVKESASFRWKPQVWYTLKSRVDLDEHGVATIRAKAWPRNEPEPEEWNIVVTHANGHRHGAPGLYGFTPQSRYRIYVDNISVAPNDR